MNCSHCAHCAAMPARPVKPAGVAPGTKGHEKCTHHEPIALPNLRTRVLCFDDRKAPTKSDVAARIRFAGFIDAAIARHHKAELARPIGDGRVAGDKAERLTARQIANRRKTPTKPSGNAIDATYSAPYAAIQANGKAPVTASRFTGRRRRRRAA